MYQTFSKPCTKLKWKIWSPGLYYWELSWILILKWLKTVTSWKKVHLWLALTSDYSALRYEHGDAVDKHLPTSCRKPWAGRTGELTDGYSKFFEEYIDEHPADVLSDIGYHGCGRFLGRQYQSGYYITLRANWKITLKKVETLAAASNSVYERRMLKNGGSDTGRDPSRTISGPSRTQPRTNPGSTRPSKILKNSMTVFPWLLRSVRPFRDLNRHHYLSVEDISI